MDKAEVLAAVEMANEGLGLEALLRVMTNGPVRYVENGVELVTSDGVVTVRRPLDSTWRVE